MIWVRVRRVQKDICSQQEAVVYTLRKTDSLKGYREEEGFKVYRRLRRLLQQVYMCCRAECIAEKLYK
jgi:hypothetical protein